MVREPSLMSIKTVYTLLFFVSSFGCIKAKGCIYTSE